MGADATRARRSRPPGRRARLTVAAALAPAVLVPAVGPTGGVPTGAEAVYPHTARAERLAIGMIGDSLTYQNGTGELRMATRFRRLGYRHIRVNGSNGRTMTADQSTAPGSLTLIRRWRAAGFTPYLYVIALGTNNINRSAGFWTRRLSETVREIGPRHRIVWVNVGIRDANDTRTRAFDANLGRFAARNPNVSMVRWNAYIHRRPQAGLWAPADGIHMTKAGYDIRNAYIARIVGQAP